MHVVVFLLYFMSHCDIFNFINFRNMLKTERHINIFELAIQSPKSVI